MLGYQMKNYGFEILATIYCAVMLYCAVLMMII